MPNPSTWTKRYGGAALITGASSGIGSAFARALAARGMDLILVARRRPPLEEVAQALRTAYGVSVTVIPKDLAQPDAASELYSETRQHQLDVGLLVNNAGFGTYGPFYENDAPAEAQMVDVNCRAPVALTHAFLPPMIERKRGGIIIVASMAGLQPTPYLAVYGATKAFDLSLGESLWAELRSQGIDVTTLAPGVVKTGFQAVADSGHMPFPGQELSAHRVVEETLQALGHSSTVVPGRLNRMLGALSQRMPRRLNLLLGARMLKPGGQSAHEIAHRTAPVRFPLHTTQLMLGVFPFIVWDSIHTAQFALYPPNSALLQCVLLCLGILGGWTVVRLLGAIPNWASDTTRTPLKSSVLLALTLCCFAGAALLLYPVIHSLTLLTRIEAPSAELLPSTRTSSSILNAYTLGKPMLYGLIGCLGGWQFFKHIRS